MLDIDIEIEALDWDAGSGGSDARAPQNFVAFGEAEPGDAKVYIKRDAYTRIEAYSESDTSRELGGILFGTALEQLGKYHIIISDFIEAMYADASASTLTFTHETWNYVHGEHERLFPDKKIVGWQHTHPGYGIFLSSYDLFIQENFFNLPFQVAYVVDPKRRTRGFFQWKSGKVERLNGFCVYDEIGKPIELPADESAERREDAPSPAAGKFAGVRFEEFSC
jgi:proteasome lid subunit RPN8/RPN11